jgi:hypothetical protein
MATPKPDPTVQVTHPGSTLCLNGSNHPSIGPAGLEIGNTPVPMLQSVVDALPGLGLVVVPSKPVPTVQE